MTVGLTTTVKLDLGRNRTRQVHVLNANPRTRAQASKLVNDGTRRIIGYAESWARSELEYRPDERRRNPEAPHYVEAFYVTPADFDRINRLVGGFGNRSPIANIIERGAVEHPIDASGGGGEASGNLVFPWDPPHSHSGPGQPPGDWPVEFSEAPVQSIYAVNHPGQAGFHFMRRAREKARRIARGSRR